MSKSIKKEIADSFSKYAKSYDAKAEIQSVAARRLLVELDTMVTNLPKGPILEVGCGTGHISEGLVSRFPNYPIVFTDIAEDMVRECRSKLNRLTNNRQNLYFCALDGEEFNLKRKCALLLSGFTFQWFQNLEQSLKKMYDSLTPDGWLLFSLPVEGSFPQWREACQKIGVDFRANPLPKEDHLVGICQELNKKGSLSFEEIKMEYSCSKDFFHSLKHIGAGKRIYGNPLSPAEMKKLMTYLDDPTSASANVLQSQRLALFNEKSNQNKRVTIHPRDIEYTDKR